MSATRRYGSARNARQSMRSRAGADVLKRLKDGDRFLVRFLQNPEDWHEAFYHYAPDFTWCTNSKSCAHCQDGVKKTKIALANVLDVQENKVLIIQMASTLADKVLEFYEEYGETVMDRDYLLTRKGAGQFDTVYNALPKDRKKKDLTRYTLLDIGKIMNAETGNADEAEEDEEPRSTKKSSGNSRRSREEEYDEEEEDFEDEDEDEEEEEDQYADLDRSELKAEIRKYDPDFVAKKSQSDDDLREILIELAEDGGSHPDEDDDEEEEEEDEKPRRSSKKSRDSGLDEFRPGKSRNPGKTARVVRRSR